MLQKIRVVRCRSISRITFCAAQRPLWPAQGMVSSSGSMIATFGSAPGSPRTSVDRLDVAMRREPALKGLRIGHGGGEADPAQARRERLQPGQRQRQQVAALAGGEGVDLVDHDRLQPLEEQEAVLMAEQQRQAFRRGQQDLRRPDALARLAVGRRVAGPRLDPDGQAPSPRPGSSKLRWTSTASALSGEI